MAPGNLVVGFLLIWQLVLVNSGDSRPADCQNQPTAKILGNKALGRLMALVNSEPVPVAPNPAPQREFSSNNLLEPGG